jgi:hypothetical protein
METTNWIVTVYNEAEKPLDSWRIENRNESEAFTEAARDVPKVEGYFDWTLVTEDFFNQTDNQTNH